MKADGPAGKNIAKFLGVSRATLYRELDETGAALSRVLQKQKRNTLNVGADGIGTRQPRRTT